jgi:hypothetical protein
LPSHSHFLSSSSPFPSNQQKQQPPDDQQSQRTTFAGDDRIAKPICACRPLSRGKVSRSELMKIYQKNPKLLNARKSFIYFHPLSMFRVPASSTFLSRPGVVPNI